MTAGGRVQGIKKGLRVRLCRCLDMIGLEFEANSQYGAAKVPYIDRLLNRLSMLRMLLRQMKEHNVIDSRQLAHYVLLLDKIGKQANGWKKHYSE